MKAKIALGESLYEVDFSEPIDLSLPVSPSGPAAWYVTPPTFEPVKIEGFVGSVKEGGSVNFRDIKFNPHGHGTHTECLGHITEKVHSVNNSLKSYMMFARLITVTPLESGNDRQITVDCLKDISNTEGAEALIIRTLPNTKEKLHKNHTGTNWPYLTSRAAERIVSEGYSHLLIDMPSVDKEEDGGKLSAHKILFGVPNKIRKCSTITETIFVPDSVVDSVYLLNLQCANFENDATPSRPVLHSIRKID